jgi:uncharacterized hydantoinase/oxoprolinase family protein
MASEVDIDGAFENLCAVEASTSATIQPHVESTSAIISHLGEGSGDVLAVYQAAAEAREDFLRNASSWVQYAMDANVLAALNVKISGYFGECATQHFGHRHGRTYRGVRRRGPYPRPSCHQGNGRRGGG